MSTRTTLAVTSTATAALLVVFAATGAPVWLPIALAVILVLEVVALLLEVRRA